MMGKAVHDPEPFLARREDDSDRGKTKVYLVVVGIASLAAAVFLIRDGDVLGHNITVLEELEQIGGSLDGAGSPHDGYILRGARMLENKYLCTYDLFSSIPTLDGSKTVTQETFAWNETMKTPSKSRLFRGGHREDAPEYGLDEGHMRPSPLCQHALDAGVNDGAINHISWSINLHVGTEFAVHYFLRETILVRVESVAGSLHVKLHPLPGMRPQAHGCCLLSQVRGVVLLHSMLGRRPRPTRWLERDFWNDIATSRCKYSASFAMDILAGIHFKGLVSESGTPRGSRRQGNPG